QPLDRWLDHSVGDALFYIAGQKGEEETLFNAFDHARKERYVISRGQVLKIASGEALVQLTLNDMGTLPTLRRSLREHLGTQEAIHFKLLLRSLALCPELKWINVLSDEGHRRWWLFSLLMSAR